MASTIKLSRKSNVLIPEAVGLVLEFSHPSHIGWLIDFDVKLPRLNNAAERGMIGIIEFAAVIRTWITPDVIEEAIRLGPSMDSKHALYVLGALGAIASSLVRHERQASGNKTSSAGIALVPGLEAGLLAFGEIVGRAPRDNHDTAWAEGFRISFMGTEGEARFGRAVREANRLLGQSTALLMPLRTGELDLTEGVDRLQQARENVEAYTQIQADLAAHPFSADFLAMRNFLATYQVGGQDWQPPNATYAFGWNAFELALGTLEGFRDVARTRSYHMSRADRTAIEESARLNTVWEQVAREVKLRDTELWTIEPEELARRLETAPPALRETVLAVRALLHETARMSGVHVGAINQNLVRPVQAMSEADRNRLGVDPTGGVSGTALKHTLDLPKKRRAHPLVQMPVGSRSEVL